MALCRSRSIIGWMSLVSAGAEILAFFVAARVLKLLGADLSSICILLAFAIRFFGYYYILNPYYLIFMETMHFFNFGILFVLIAQKAAFIGKLRVLNNIEFISLLIIAPPGLSGTLQGLAFGVLFGLGMIFVLFVHLYLFIVEQVKELV
jgi:hypothetical protein